MDPFRTFDWSITDEDPNVDLLPSLTRCNAQDSLWNRTTGTGTVTHDLPPSLPLNWNFDAYGQPHPAALLSNTLIASSSRVSPTSAQESFSGATASLAINATSADKLDQFETQAAENPCLEPRPDPKLASSKSKLGVLVGSTASATSGGGKRKLRPHVRGSRACQSCRKLRMRCSGEQPCDRCRKKGASCTFDQPTASATALTVDPSNQPSIEGGVSNRRNIRDLLSKDDILLLHFLYMKDLNPDLPLLQEDIHTAQFLSKFSPFLYCVMCFVSCRLLDRPRLHQTLHQIIRKDAFLAMTEGRRRIETVQAYLILSYWSIGAKADSQDLSWLYASFAFRLALDLNLHGDQEAGKLWQIPGLSTAQAQANRERTWICCLFIDRLLSPQRGKPTSLPITKRSVVTANNALEWARGQPEMVCIAALLTLQNYFINALDALNDVDTGVRREVEHFERTGAAWLAEVQGLLGSPLWQGFSVEKFQQWQHLLTLHYSYTSLVVHQYALEDALSTRDPSLIRRERPTYRDYSLCQHLARHVIVSFLSDQRGKCRSDSYLVCVAYSCITLLRLAHQRFDVLRGPHQNLQVVVDATNRLLQLQTTFSTPRLFGHFLCYLIIELSQSTEFQECSQAALSVPKVHDASQAGCKQCAIDFLNSSSFTESLIVPGFDLRRGSQPSDHILESSLVIQCCNLDETPSIFDFFTIE